MNLEWVAGKIAANRNIGRSEIRGKRPSLIGYLNLIRPNRIQIVGIPEFRYLQNMGMDTDSEDARRLFQSDCNIIIFSDQQVIPPDYFHLADEYQVALMRTTIQSHELISSLQHHIAHDLAEHVTLHGVLMDVLGIGVLITGESNIGKSELALQLVTRGHCLIADDAPDFTRIAHNTLEGSCPYMLRDFLEVRGLGILNIRKMYGNSSTRYRKIIKLIVHLEPARRGQKPEYNRLSGEQTTNTILDVPITRITIPVAPGRNLAVLVEVGVRNYRLRKGGYNASDHIIKLQADAIEAK
jgi:HPr kinase/phosphorylase